MFKKTAILACLVAGMSSAYAGDLLGSKVDTLAQAKADAIKAELPTGNPMLVLIERIADLKASHPELSAEELVDVIDLQVMEMKKSGGSALFAASGPSIASVYDQWSALTNAEKVLIATHPVNAALTIQTKDMAFELTQTHMGQNGLGNKSDAFRHAIWNALMSRYISENWAYMFATAHEDKPQDELNKRAPDGHFEYEHKEMDLHNNKEGRDVWHWYDTVLTTSNEDLVDRINDKILTGQKSVGQLYWLHN